MSNFKILSTFYLLLVTGLFLYSYTQVDLNLTLSKLSIWQTIEKSFQYIGWFNRPLSTLLFIIILVLLVACYAWLLWLIQRNKLTVKQFWCLLIPVSVILLFSYNAFSYDLFNYMFDARILTYHQQNPYGHKALDYPSDPWINFMRWTHRTYPYGPVWLGLTVPLSFIGLQIFLPTLYLFKALMVASMLGTAYFIGKILERINPKERLLGMAAFALNPLVIIESLVSAHHDIVMMCLAIIAIYFLLDKKYIRAFLLLFLSIGIKFATVFLLPIFIGILIMQRGKKEISWDKVFSVATIGMIVAVIFASMRTELQPWYMLWVLPFVSLLPKKKALPFGSLMISIAVLLHYVPFLHSGNWDAPIPTIKWWLTTSGVMLAILAYFFSKRFR